jgi:hypothetical protein
MLVAGSFGAIVAGIPYMFAYTAAIQWLSARRIPPSSELLSVEALAFYGFIGLPIAMLAGAAVCMWPIRRRWHRSS